MRRSFWIFFVALVGLTAVPGICRAAEATTGLEPQSVSSPAPGVTTTNYLDTGPTVLHVTRIAAGAQVVIKAVPASPSGQGATATVATLCQQAKAVACINGDFFDRSGIPLGGELVNGKVLRPPTAIQQQLWLDSSDHFSIGAQPPHAFQSLGATNYAILVPGKPISIPEHDHFADGRHARTLVGWNAVGDRFFVTVDQDARSRGMSLAQAAAVLQQLGATTAVNEDGGGSSQMVVDGVLLHAPGDIARPVANIWAIVALPPTAIPLATRPPGPAQAGHAPGGPVGLGALQGLSDVLNALLHPAAHSHP